MSNIALKASEEKVDELPPSQLEALRRIDQEIRGLEVDSSWPYSMLPGKGSPYHYSRLLLAGIYLLERKKEKALKWGRGQNSL